MSPGIGGPELLVVLVLALVVVGPQQLPVLMRKVGRMMAQARAMAKEFQASFEEIGRETELSELRKEIEALKKANPIEDIRGEIDKTALAVRDDRIRDMKIAQAEKSRSTVPPKQPDPIPAADNTIHAPDGESDPEADAARDARQAGKDGD
ncbi:Sec-independent protein translocase protein TatB [Maricaulis sp. CAU 1757]